MTKHIKLGILAGSAIAGYAASNSSSTVLAPVESITNGVDSVTGYAITRTVGNQALSGAIIALGLAWAVLHFLK